jgi:hypothetical protein
MTRNAAPNFSFKDAIYVPMLQSGDKNYVEVKLTDRNGTVYYSHRTYEKTGQYFVLKAPLKDFVFFQGQSGSSFDLKAVYTMQFSVSRFNTGHSGTVIFGVPVAGSESTVFQDFGNQSVITRLDVQNNPFKVDGTGFNNAAIFKFTLSEPANIRFRVYNLKGIILYESIGDYVIGDNSFQWDGRNNSGILQNSGLYIYQIYAKGATDGKDQKFNNILGIGK